MAITDVGIDVAYLVIGVVCALATLGLGIVSIKIKTVGDKARRGIPWYHASLWLFFT